MVLNRIVSSPCSLELPYWKVAERRRGGKIRVEEECEMTKRKDITLALVGHLSIAYPLISAAPEPARRRMRARLRRRLRLLFQTKGVGCLFQPCAGYLGHPFRKRDKILGEDQHCVKKSEQAAFNFILSKSFR